MDCESRPAEQWKAMKNLFPWITAYHLTRHGCTDPSHSFRMTTDAFLIMTPYRPRSFWTGTRIPYEKGREAGQWHRVKNLLPWMTSCGFPHHGNRSFAIASGWRLNVLYKDHGAGRQKELLAHAVRLMIPACRNDLIVKEYLACSRQLTADSFYLLTVFLTTAANPSPLISKAMGKQRLLFSVFCLWPTANSYRPSFPFRKIRVIYKNSGKRHSVFIFFHV